MSAVSTTTMTTNSEESRRDHPLRTRAAIERFVREYNAMAVKAARVEAEDNVTAANAHVEIGASVARFLDENERNLSTEDVTFLRGETVARCMQALVLRSIELSGFGDIAVSLSAQRKIDADLRAARRRATATGEHDDAGDGGGGDEDGDPRERTAGLYEYLAHDQIIGSLDDLVGYETQHRAILHAYFVLDETAREGEALQEAVSDRPMRSRAGANVLLYGPPGTGKTAAAKAVTRTLGLNFAFVNAENLVSAYRSETEKNLRRLYAKMRALVRVTGRNVVLLLDEVDGLVKNRTNGEITNGDYSLLTNFLTILEPNDGADNFGIMSIFTTNRAENLDDAFRRRCTAVFFGYIEGNDARRRVLERFLGNSVEDLGGSSRELADKCREWVPGDYVRFLREVLRPMRLRAYLAHRGLSEVEFFAGLRGGGARGAAERSIVVELPRVAVDSVERAMSDFVPTTPRARYEAYLST